MNLLKILSLILIAGSSFVVWAGDCKSFSSIKECCEKSEETCVGDAVRAWGADAAQYYGYLCDDKFNGFSKDNSKAADWCQRAGGLLTSQKGQGEKAIGFLDKACQGNSKYCYDLIAAKATIYSTGKSKNDGKATETASEVIEYCGKPGNSAQCNKTGILKWAEKQVKLGAKQSAQKDVALCKCLQHEKFIQGQIDHENEVGAASGFVDKSRLHSLGSILVMVRKFRSKLEANRSPASEPVCPTKFRADVAAECGNWAAQSNISEMSGGQ